MSPILFAAVLLLFANQGKALEAESICCEEIESLLENKTKAYQTVCLGPESGLPNSCCRNIETEIEKYRYAYKTLCHEVISTPTPTVPLTEAPVIKCKTSLGIETGRISDVAMTSSSILDTSSFPHYARLRNQNGNCTWLPANTAGRNSSWVQIDLGNQTNVSAVATQGSCSGDQWTKSYVIMYSNNSLDWKTYGDLGPMKVFIGNKDSSSVVTNYFKTPFEARFVRISPRTWNKNAALRIELFTNNCNLSTISSSKPRSCLDHLKNGLKTNGYYNIYDASSNLVTVYCDMTSESGKAWTLVMSWATKNKNMAEFRSTALSADSPVDEDLPNWNKYRMSLSMMNDLSNQSTHWRATCSFPTHGVDYVDYVRGNFADLDVVNFLQNGACKRVEYVNIRGHQCSDCDLMWYQYTGYYPLHVDLGSTACGFDATQGAVSSEDNFGYYYHMNSNFRCTADADATTNWWFGGNIA